MKKAFNLLVLSLIVAVTSFVNANTSPLTIANNDKEAVQKKVVFRVWLNNKKLSELAVLIKRIYTQGDPMYQHFLSKAQMKNDFSPSDQQVDSVKKYFLAQGMQATHVGTNNSYVEMTATSAQVATSFRLKTKSDQEQAKILQTEASLIPASLSDNVTIITGLNNIPSASAIKKHVMPNLQTSNNLKVYTSPRGLYASITAGLLDKNGQVIQNYMQFRGFILSTATTPPSSGGYSVSQLRHAYGVDTLISEGIDGTNQTVVIPWRGITNPIFTTLQSDVDYFSQQEGIPSTTLQIRYPVGGAPTNSTCYDAGETTQDIEAVHAFAPKATIILSTEDCLSTNDDQSMLVDSIYQDYGQVISNSFALPEQGGSALPLTVEPALMYAAATGVTVNFSSGDSGDGVVKFGSKSVTYPASSAWATAVGGTSLFLDQNGNYLTENAWGSYSNTSYICITQGSAGCLQYQASSNPGSEFQGGSTGGVSTVYAAPTWQENIKEIFAGGYGIISSFHNCGSNQNEQCRATPDVSMLADGNTGMQGYRTLNNTTQPFIADGTSLACPLFSAIVALVNQNRSQHGKSNIGLIASHLYHLPVNAVRPILGAHGIGNPVVGVPDPNAFQLFNEQANTGNLVGFSFGQDSSLTPGPTWSDTNGVGSPYAPTFVTAMLSL